MNSRPEDISEGQSSYTNGCKNWRKDTGNLSSENAIPFLVPTLDRNIHENWTDKQEKNSLLNLAED